MHFKAGEPIGANPAGKVAVIETQILTREFEGILNQIKDTRPKVCTRFRKMSEPWPRSFMQVTDVCSLGAVLYNPKTKEYAYAYDLADVVEFELDKKFRKFLPYVKYEVARVKFIS